MKAFLCCSMYTKAVSLYAFVSKRRSSYTVPDVFVRFQKISVFVKRFSLKYPVSNFTDIFPVGSALIHAKKQDGLKKVGQA
jgi:hypothetical protein